MNGTMKSLRELYRIGRGPSASHTMGPHKAACIFAERYPDAARFEVTLYGSLAATGKGHMTDVAITDALQPVAPVEIHWHPEVVPAYHTNGMLFQAFGRDGGLAGEWTVYSVGGGALSEGEGRDLSDSGDVYTMNTMTEITEWCDANGRSFWEYVDLCEGPGIWDYLREVWEAMRASVERGLQTEGRLPGPLNLARKAATYHIKALGYQPNLRSRGLVFAYALAVSEENASGGTIVAAPTCGSSGVLPGVLYHLANGHSFSETQILHALAEMIIRDHLRIVVDQERRECRDDIDDSLDLLRIHQLDHRRYPGIDLGTDLIAKHDQEGRIPLCQYFDVLHTAFSPELVSDDRNRPRF